MAEKMKMMGTERVMLTVTETTAKMGHRLVTRKC
jgi:hypothetical protein